MKTNKFQKKSLKMRSQLRIGVFCSFFTEQSLRLVKIVSVLQRFGVTVRRSTVPISGSVDPISVSVKSAICRSVVGISPVFGSKTADSFREL